MVDETDSINTLWYCEFDLKQIDAIFIKCLYQVTERSFSTIPMPAAHVK